MSLLFFLLAIVVALAACAFGLAQHWANTPHGRLRPIFAVAFKVQGILRPKTLEGVLATEPMETPEQRSAARKQFLKGTASMSKPIDFAGTIEDRDLDGPGGSLPVRIYTPPGEGPFPLMVYLHGGGFIVGSPDYTDVVTRAIAARTPAVVVSVDYRLSPEVTYPAAVEDSEFVVDWCIEHAEALKLQPGAVSVGGDSAGGNLAAVLAQRARDTGRDHIGLQVLIYPTVDCTRKDRESQVAFASGYGLSLRDVSNCLDYYIPADLDRNDPGVSPLHATRFEGLAPALVFTAGFDVLRDEGTEYADRLAKAGVDVEHIREPHVPHGYITMNRVCSEAENSIEHIASALRKLSSR